MDCPPHQACVVFGGDLNPRPHVPLDAQLRPLVERNITPTNPLVAGSTSTATDFNTWDLTQPLARCQ